MSYFPIHESPGHGGRIMVEDDANAAVEGPATEVAGEQPDLYYHGIIRRLSPRKGTGVVRTASGRDVRFSYQMVLMSGPVRSPKGLREGMVVGYDLGWTGHGLRVIRIKTYPHRNRHSSGREPGRDLPADAPSVADQGQGQDLAREKLSHEDPQQGDVE